MQFSSPSVSRTPPTLATLVLLSGLSALSMNLYLPSLPFMATYFQTDYKVMQLSIALYLLVNAALQILIGPIADKAGRRPVLLWGLALFLLATLGCIYAPNVETFLAFSDPDQAIAFEKYLKTSSGIAFARKRLRNS